MLSLLTRRISSIRANFAAWNRGFSAFAQKPSISQGNNSQLVKPFLPIFTQICGMKQVGFVRRRCKDCYIVTRQGRNYVMCKSQGRHKQMQIAKKPHMTWILTHATQCKERPY